MRRNGMKFEQAGNCFLWVEDYARAQDLLQEQEKTDWVKLLNSLADQLNPLRESTILHRFHDEAAHGGDALLKDTALIQAESCGGFEAPLQLFPDAVVRPFGEVFSGAALQIEAAELRRAHAQQGESARMVAVDRLLGAGGASARMPSQPKG
jgi:hypothetical protein